MATKKFYARNIWASALNIFALLWSFVKNLYATCMWILITLIRVIFLYNPIMLPIVLLFGHQEKAAKVLLGKKEDFYDELWDLVPIILCRWEVFLLPWFIRKDFVRLYPERFSFEDQVKLTISLSVDAAEAFIKKMPDEAKELLWQRGLSRYNVIIAKQKQKLDVKTLKFLLLRGEISLIKDFILRNTPSAECIQEMINRAILFDKKHVAEILRFIALKHGLSASIIKLVYAKCDDETIKIVENALVQRNQWLMINKLENYGSTNSDLWKQFCEQNPEIWEGAQKEMPFWMLKEYYATSHKLSEDAIIYFLSTEDTYRDDIAKVIFSNEGKLSDKIISIIRSIPDVYSIYLQTRKG